MSQEPRPSSARLAELARSFANRTVLTVGDLVADEFVYGEIARVSREAPVMILRYESTETVPGGAGNAAANVAALGGASALASVVGRDRTGRAVTTALRRMNVGTAGLTGVRDRATPTKTRLLAGLTHSLRQQVIRVDNDPPRFPEDAALERLARHVTERASQADIAILSDYNYGSVSGAVVDALRAASANGLRIIVDSRYRIREFAGFASATPNEVELEAYAGRTFATTEDVIDAGRRALAELGLGSLLVTRGSHGMILFERDATPAVIPTVGNAPAIDVTGAGDSVIAAFALSLAAGATALEAAHIANHAGGIVVMKRGTATVSSDELVASIEQSA